MLGRDGGPAFPGYDASVPATVRRVACLLTVGLLAACGASVPTAPSALRSAVAPTLSPVPTKSSGDPAATPPSTTNTAFGTIWDELPDSFPRMARSVPADVPGPASAVFQISTDPATAGRQIEAALSDAGWSVDVGSPLEDGSIVLEATAEPNGCKAEIRFTPLGGSVIMSVLLAAACPFG